jgi:hypothetical protein
MTTTDSTAIPTRMSQCLAAPAPMGRSRVRSSRNRGMEDRSAGTAEAAGTDRSATDCHTSRAVDATLVEQQVIALLQVIVLHTVGRLLARIPDTSEGIW